MTNKTLEQLLDEGKTFRQAQEIIKQQQTALNEELSTEGYSTGWTFDEYCDQCFLGDYGRQILDYSEGYICDIFTEMADNNVDIYTADLMNWAADNIEELWDAESMFGSQPSLDKLAQLAQFDQIDRQLNEDAEDIVKFWLINKLDTWLETSVSISEQHRLTDLINMMDIDTNDRIEDIWESFLDEADLVEITF